MRKYIAYDSDEPIGFLQIIDLRLEVSQYWWEFTENIRAIDIWIWEEKNLWKWYGTQMMQRAILECFKDPWVTEIWIDPLATNTKVHNFYEKLWFIFDHEQWFDEDHCYVYKLTRHQF
jgi:aminoglycoside 6'-N-acetyltransferase